MGIKLTTNEKIAVLGIIAEPVAQYAGVGSGYDLNDLLETVFHTAVKLVTGEK